MTILDTIIASKREEVAERKACVPVRELERSGSFERNCLSLEASLNDPDRTGIIAEFKRRSPSKGWINQFADVARVTEAYNRFGASGLSVLTDSEYFGGSADDLLVARRQEIPILRKDFIIDQYQLLEAKAMGADVILLIAACLTPTEVKQLAKFARQLGLDVLLELHAEEELEHVCEYTNIVGINNRDLKTFRVNIERSLDMASRLPRHLPKVAESGINSVDDVVMFRENGFKGFLIGENFMKAADPALAFEAFVQELRTVTR
ncbi:indole-3-glycerol phosphate synthase TrpC [Flavihumibacter rivuli]|uniref:indole-3-glycerol phosphate synthase TrpC n=1 Tax=Flavihumibacter rivuli TaxID=2838156 RepID=UPI001BDE7B2B|nr:indole-3-glycerol phosphate synthase TrpC [Flavihumibacter rivuli]ULQ57226.1 indole-3-glycerol phosphate synthase TrpC [Flavihumibacter rivuli]